MGEKKYIGHEIYTFILILKILHNFLVENNDIKKNKK